MDQPDPEQRIMAQEDPVGYLRQVRDGHHHWRQNLIRKWTETCMASGSKFGIEAAHIIPWSKASAEERVALDNGLLLNVSFHRAFDRGVLKFKRDEVQRVWKMEVVEEFRDDLVFSGIHEGVLGGEKAQEIYSFVQDLNNRC
uniref:HNH nuclease domain-containing protein n=1 Tax=Paramoeba aestuarina TaxID=180227 RepID=A0A7S4P6S2_9EUKA|mmetsp:Transcript_3710/g.5621  ORF Transcript_3710/g.5621 Transcript_3710/m.5621 type:complete len:142 (+) Transcript_3710:92-517(+)